MKLLIDMNLSPRWVETLRRAGHEAAHWSTVGRLTATDREVAEELGAGALVTIDASRTRIRLLPLPFRQTL